MIHFVPHFLLSVLKVQLGIFQRLKHLLIHLQLNFLLPIHSILLKGVLMLPHHQEQYLLQWQPLLHLPHLLIVIFYLSFLFPLPHQLLLLPPHQLISLIVLAVFLFHRLLLIAGFGVEVGYNVLVLVLHFLWQ